MRHQGGVSLGRIPQAPASALDRTHHARKLHLKTTRHSEGYAIAASEELDELFERYEILDDAVNSVNSVTLLKVRRSVRSRALCYIAGFMKPQRY
jgi:hypothetical protein